MSRKLQPFHADDISALARSLCRQLVEHLASKAQAPSHLGMLNMLARAQGHRNLQAWLAAQPVLADLPAPALPALPGPALPAQLERALKLVDEAGRVTRWPSRRGLQPFLAWYLWTLFEARRSYSEGEVNALLIAHNAFGDHVLLRRELINEKLLSRTPDGRVYRKEVRRAPPEMAQYLRALRARRKADRAAQSAARLAQRLAQRAPATAPARP